MVFAAQAMAENWNWQLQYSVHVNNNDYVKYGEQPVNENCQYHLFLLCPFALMQIPQWMVVLLQRDGKFLSLSSHSPLQNLQTVMPSLNEPLDRDKEQLWKKLWAVVFCTVPGIVQNFVENWANWLLVSSTTVIFV